jgi:hypothetical protein
MSAELWPPLERAYSWVHRAAHLLANADGCTGEQVRTRYQQLLDEMVAGQAELGPLSAAVDQFRKVTLSFAPGLFQCYDVPDLPRTVPRPAALLRCGALPRAAGHRATRRDSGRGGARSRPGVDRAGVPRAPADG